MFDAYFNSSTLNCLSSQVLPHSHNSVHSLSPLSICEISSKLCFLPSFFSNLMCYPRSPLIGPVVVGCVLLNNLPHIPLNFFQTSFTSIPLTALSKFLSFSLFLTKS